MSTESRSQSLVVIAVDAAGRGDYAVELARTLARTDTPELLGVFVESSELLAHAGSRLAREILLSGSERALERGALERQLRSQAALARATFEAASARLGLRHRFEVARGEIFAESVKRASAAEALVVSLAQSLAGRSTLTGLLRQLAAERPPLLMLARQGWLTGHSIAVLVDELSPATEATLLAAARVAAQSGSPMTVLVPEVRDVEAGKDAERMADVFGRYGVEARNVIRLSGNDAARIGRAARACQARLLVLPSSSEITGSASAMDELMRQFSGALMLVRP